MMSDNKKKEKEKFWLNRLKDAANLSFEIEDLREIQEHPDFLIRYQNRIVGVEIAELQLDRDMDSSKGSTLQQEMSLQEAVVSRAQELFFEQNSQLINAKVYFSSNPKHSLKSITRLDLAQSIVETLQQVSISPWERIKLDQYTAHLLPISVGYIDVLGLPYEAIPRWQVIAPGWAKVFHPEDVESLLEAKNNLLDKYKESIVENWLVIIADGTKPPGMFHFTDEQYTKLPDSKFDKTFFVCYPDRFFIEWP